MKHVVIGVAGAVVVGVLWAIVLGGLAPACVLVPMGLTAAYGSWYGDREQLFRRIP